MSFCGASCFTCYPRASSASATSASSPTEGAPPCCHAASPLSTPLHRKTNRKLPPLLHRTRCGAVPSAAERWPLSNDSPRHNSNSVLHHCWPRLHELTRPHTALSAPFRASRRSVSPLLLRQLLSAPASALFGHRLVFAQPRQLLLHQPLRLQRTSTTLPAPCNLHKSRVRRASGFLLTAFSNATHTSFQS